MPYRQWIDGPTLQDSGILQEANRLFFHPLGISLLHFHDDAKGAEWLHLIRVESTEGIQFKDLDPQKAARFRQFAQTCHGCREDALGYVIQPLASPPRGRSTLHESLIRQEEEMTIGDLRRQLMAGLLHQIEIVCKILFRLFPSGNDGAILDLPDESGSLQIELRPLLGQPGIHRQVTFRPAEASDFLPLVSLCTTRGASWTAAFLSSVLPFIQSHIKKEARHADDRP